MASDCSGEDVGAKVEDEVLPKIKIHLPCDIELKPKMTLTYPS